MAEVALFSDDQKVLNWRGSFVRLVSFFYFFQGFYHFGASVYALAMMANWGISTDTQATIIAILGLPTYIKILPALLSDRVPVGRWGRRRPYIVLGGLLYIPGFGLLIANQQFGPTWIGALLICMLAWMLVDSSLDAMTVDITPRDRSAQLQSAASGSQSVGVAVGTLFVSLLGPRIGWTPVLIALCAGALIQSAIPLVIRETSISSKTLQSQLPLGSVIRKAFSHRLVWLSMFFFLFFSSTLGFRHLTSVYILTELGWSSSPETMASYGVVRVVSLISSAIGAFVVGRLPVKAVTSFKFYVVYLALFWCLSLPWLAVDRVPESLAWIYLASIIFHLGLGVGSALSLAMAMRVCPKSIEGFTFALMISLMSFGMIALGPKTVTAFADRWGGIVPAFFVLIPFGLVSLLFLYPMLKSLNRQEIEPSPAAG
jgi:MFS family permease